MNKKMWVLFLSLLMLALVAGCSSEDGVLFKGATANGTLDADEAGENMSFGLMVEKDGDPIGVYFETTLSEGSISLQMEDSSGNVVWSEPASNTVIQKTFTDLEKGDYRLGWAWEGAVKGSYSFAWQPGGMAAPPVTGWIWLPGGGMLIVALGFIYYALRNKLGWRYLLLGALAWMFTVSLKLTFATFANQPILDALRGALAQSIADPIFYIYVGLLTGVFEVALTYLAMRYTRAGKADWKRALSFGIGFGAVEALLLSISPLALAVTLAFSPDSLPLSTRLNMGSLNHPLYGLASGWERLFTILTHIFCNVLIFLAVVKRKPGWFWLSFGYKSLLDVGAAYAQMTGVGTLGRIWTIEAYVAILGIIALWGITRVKKMYPEEEIITMN